MGGPIPLGNVGAANGMNGIIVLADKASYFTPTTRSVGLAAFSLTPDVSATARTAC